MTDLATELATDVALDVALDVASEAPEAPLLISDLAAWYDSRTDDYFTLNGSGVSAWASRAGTMGATPLSQATAGSQPLRATSVAVLGGKNAVQFDGVDDFMDTATAADWTFLHNNTGATIFLVERADSTGLTTQTVYMTCPGTTAQMGVVCSLAATAVALRVCNGSGTYQNNWSNSNAAHYARDVSRWRSCSYGAGVQTSVVSGSTLTNADTVGQVPAVGAPLNALRLGRAAGATSSLKGYVAQIIIFKRVLTAPEIASLAAWAAAQYGVAA